MEPSQLFARIGKLLELQERARALAAAHPGLAADLGEDAEALLRHVAQRWEITADEARLVLMQTVGAAVLRDILGDLFGPAT